MKRIIIAVLLLESLSAWGRDTNSAYRSAGTFSCGQYIEGVRTGRKIQFEAWISGYIVAFNLATPDTYDILAGTDLISVQLWMENYCKQNPLKDIEEGMGILAKELYPRRHRSAKDAGK